MREGSKVVGGLGDGQAGSPHHNFGEHFCEGMGALMMGARMSVSFFGYGGPFERLRK